MSNQDPVSYLTHALAIREQTLGSEHSDMTQSYFWLAVISQQQQHYEAAELLYQRALSVWKRLLESHHPRTSALRRHYVSLLQMGRGKEVIMLELPMTSRDEEVTTLETTFPPQGRSIQ